MKYLVYLCLFSCFVGLGQKEASQWRFGALCGVNFLTNPPTSVNTGSIFTAEGCASMADAAGNLLFYTNGYLVWNAANAMMPNFINGHNSSAQSSLIIHKSGSQYYIFTTGAFGTGDFGYSIVDMSLAAGLGSVTASYSLSAGVAEKLTATRHCNGTDVWVMVHKMGSNAFEAYQAGPSGVNSTPVVSNIGSVYAGNYYYGPAKFSPNGTKLATSVVDAQLTQPNYIELYDFNPATGLLSNSLTIGTFTSFAPGHVEFSPDGSKLFTTAYHYTSMVNNFRSLTILQWDLCNSATIAASQLSVISFTSTNGASLQSATNGKIYFDCPITSTAPVLGCINNPNLSGAACGASLNVLYLTPGGNSGGSLPNFVTSIMRQKPVFSSVSSCGSVSFSPVQTCAGAGNVPISYKWLFGDATSGAANSSTLNNPIHNYSSNGIYSVSLIANYTCYSDTTVTTVTVTALPNLTVTGKSSICNKESATFTVSGANSYTWNSGSQSTTLTVNPGTTTVYTVSGSNGAGCQSSKSITLTVKACVALEENNLNPESIKIYPNPSDGIYTIESTINCRITLLNQIGQNIKEITINQGQNQLDLRGLPSGVYYLNGNQGILRGKILLQGEKQ